MGLLQGTDQDYYQGNNYGSYQFTSLDDIITQFQIAYVGESKIIPKVKRTDVAFHAMRAMQEFSFDTFKSVKSQEIVLPPSLKMILPRDYVNYTQVSWVDTKGIKHPLYSTKHTSNPFSILQEPDGDYLFSEDSELISDNFFEAPNGVLSTYWARSPLNQAFSADPLDSTDGGSAGNLNRIHGGGFKIGIDNSRQVLRFHHTSSYVSIGGGNTGVEGKVLAAWHEIDTVGIDSLDISAVVNAFQNTSSIVFGDANHLAGVGHSADVPDGEVVIGIQTQPGDGNTRTVGPPYVSQKNNPLYNPTFFSRNNEKPDLGYIEWGAGDAGTDTFKELEVNVSAHDKVYFIISSFVRVTGREDYGARSIWSQGNPAVFPKQYVFENVVNEVSVKNVVPPSTLAHSNATTKDSSTWDSYKSSSNNTNDSYSYDQQRNLHLNEGRRYGLSPEHAQENGSFYIDNLKGQINFSSTISGKTIILDYISDSLGTDEEMQVHKFAEEAMYKSILCDIMSTRQNVPEYAIRRYKKDKSASKRNAKLRLSNIKPNEIIQIFRNKSKQIK